MGKKQKPNAPCTCGSGKKYKKCCKSKDRMNTKGVLLNLANSFFSKKKYTEAEIQYKKAIEIDSNYKEAYCNLGNCYKAINKYTEAEIQYKKAIEIDSNFKEAYYNLGVCYVETKKYTEAEIQYKKVIEIDSNFKEAYCDLGVCYYETKKYTEAEIQYKKVIEIDSNFKEAYCNLGNCYNETKKYTEAEIQYKKAIEIDPNYKKANTALSNIYLFNGDIKRGFELYEYRFCHRGGMGAFNHINSTDLPFWDRTDQNVLIMWEQGFGDNFQFFRFVTPLKKQYPNINFTFLCQKKINHLFNPIVPIVTTIDIKKYDSKLALMSIPHVLELNSIKPFAEEPYIKVNQDKLSFWKTKLSTNYKIGLCWTGNKEMPNIEKYIPLELFKNIADLNVELISLQKGDGEEELDTITFKNKIKRFEIDTVQSFTDTVAILKNIDLFITVDTSLVHLAGILGVKTYLVLGYISEWRWGKEGRDTYWYDSVKIFRSNKIGDWYGVLGEIKNELITNNPC